MKLIKNVSDCKRKEQCIDLNEVDLLLWNDEYTRGSEGLCVSITGNMK